MSCSVVPESASSNNIDRRMISIGSGDNVMAELQSKLKGRGQINPTHTQSIRAVASSANKPPPLTTTLTTDFSKDENIKMMQIRLKNFSPIENTSQQLNDTSSSPTVVTIDISTASGERELLYDTKEEIKEGDQKDEVLSVKLNNTRTLSTPNLVVNKLTQPIYSTHSVSTTDVSCSLPLHIYDQEREGGGVRQLARIFSARSKGESTPSSDGIITSRKASFNVLCPSNDNQLKINSPHPYQNVTADQWSPPPKKTTLMTNQITPKKPMPTPRKSSPGAPAEIIDTATTTSFSSMESQDSDEYEFVDISEEPHNEVNVFQPSQQLAFNTKSHPPLASTSKWHPTTNKPHLQVTKSPSGNVIPRRNTPRLLKELRKGIVTDGDNIEDDYITMNITNSGVFGETNDKTDSYLTVLENSSIDDNKYMTMKRSINSSVQSISSNSASKEQISKPSDISNKGWKRTQGSLFAQEMIDTLYCQISERNRFQDFCSIDDSDDGGSQSYIDIYEIPGNFLSSKKSNFHNFDKHPPGPPPPVPNRPLVGPAAPKIDHHGDIQVPLLPPKSESMLREVYESEGDKVISPPPVRGITSGKSKSDKKKLKLNKSLPLISSVKTKHVISAPVMSSSPALPTCMPSLSPSFSSPYVLPTASPSISPSSPSGNVKKVINVLRKETFSEEKSKKLVSESFPLDEKPRKPLPLPTRKTEPALTPPLHTDYTSLDGNSSHTPSPKSSPRPAIGKASATKTPLERKGVVKRRHKKGNGGEIFSGKINRDSLVVILQNHDVIMEHLKKRSLEKDQSLPLDARGKKSPMLTDSNAFPLNKSHNSPELHDTSFPLSSQSRTNLDIPTIDKDTLVQSLGNLLVEMSSLLIDDKDEKEEKQKERTLISTIEQELHIKLQMNPSYLKRSTPAKHPSEDDYHDLTEEDVINVVKYFDDNCTHPENIEENDQNKLDSTSSSTNSSPYFSSRKSFLTRSNSDAVLLNDNYRSGSLTSLHSNPEVYSGHSHSENISPDITQSVSIAVENLIKDRNGKSVLRHNSSVRSNDIHSLSTSVSCKGVGYFTSFGGTITSKDSGVIVEVPPGAVSIGRRQKIWFEVHQTVYRESDEEDIYHSLGSFSDRRKSDSSFKKESRIQCSPIVSIGPADIMLHKPIKINLPHCVPYDSSAWNLKVKGRGQGSSSNEWMSLSPSSSSSIFSRPGGPKKSFKTATYQLHPNYVRVKTKLSGYYKLVGRPMTQNGNKVVKNMVCSIYTEREKSDDVCKIKVFFVNAILDCVEALDKSLTSDGYQCIERNIPLLCYGNQSDFKVNLSMDTPTGRTASQTQMIPYGMLWKVTRVGYSRLTFTMAKHLSSSSNNHLYSLSVLQADKESLQINFMLPQI